MTITAASLKKALGQGRTLQSIIDRLDSDEAQEYLVQALRANGLHVPRILLEAGTL
jgi:hypothetical protein